MRFLLPSNLETFLAGYVEQSSHIPALASKIHAIVSEGPHLTPKHFGKRTLYCLDLNFGKHAHRVLFEQLTLKGTTYLKPCYFVWCHNYPKKVPITPSISSTEGFDVITPSVPPGFNPLPVAMTYFQGQWLEPTMQQSLILRDMRMPQLVVGPPGSGKTFLIMRLMQEQALSFLNEQKSGVYKMLYFTDSQRLVRQMKNTWSEWEKENLPNPSRIIAHFTTRDKYALWYAETTLNVQPTHLTLDERLLKDLPSGITQQSIKDELLHNAYILNQDLQNKKSFGDSRYKQLGQRQSIFDEEQRAALYPRFCRLLVQLEQEKQFVTGITPLHLTQREDAFDLVLVDEAQKESTQTLISLINTAKANQCLLFGDRLQSQKQCCGLSKLATECHSENIQLHIETRLFTTERLHHQVAAFNNAIVLLHNTLKKGLDDNISYSSITAELPVSPEDNMIYRFEQVDEENFKKIGQNPKAAAIVLDPNDKPEAQALIHGHHLFDPDEAGGLEFELTLLYLSSQTLEQFSALSQKMQEQGITADSELTPKLNKSSEKKTSDSEVYSLLSSLLIAVSRTYGKLWIYYPAPDKQLQHKINPFLSWLQVQIGEIPPKAPVLEEKVSSTDDWLSAIHRLLSLGLTTQAKGSLTDKIGLQAQEAMQFIQDYERKSAPCDSHSLEKWKAGLQKTEQAAAASASTRKINTPSLQAQALSEASPAKAAPALSPINQPLSPAVAKWVENLYGVIENLNNVKILFKHRAQLNILFNHNMENGLSLWLNLFISQKLAGFLKKIAELPKEEKAAAKLTLNHLLSISEHPLIELSLSFHQKAFLNLGITFTPVRTDNQSAWVKFIHTLEKPARLDVLTYLMTNLEKTNSMLTYQTQGTKGLGLSLLHQLFIAFPFEMALTYNPILPILKQHIGLTVTDTENPYRGMSILYGMLRTLHATTEIPPSLANLPKLPSQELIKLLVIPLTGESSEQNKTALFYLAQYAPTFLSVIKGNVFEKHFDVFCKPCTGDGAEKGFTPLLCLAKTNLGRNEISAHWKTIREKINSDPSILFACTAPNNKVQESLLMSLFNGEDALSLTESFWSDFKPWIDINPSALFKPYTNSGHHVLHGLCNTAAGIQLMNRHWSDFKPWIEQHLDAMFTPIHSSKAEDGVTCIFRLFNLWEGIEFINEYWEEFERWMGLKQYNPLRQNFEMNQGAILIYLISNLDNSKMMKTGWNTIKTWIDEIPEILFKHIKYDGKQTLSPFYILCNTHEGKALLEREWQAFKQWMQQTPPAYLENTDNHLTNELLFVKRVNQLLVDAPELLKKLDLLMPAVLSESASSTQGMFCTSSKPEPIEDAAALSRHSV